MRSKKSDFLNKRMNRIQLLTIVFAGLFLSGCSDDKPEQAKQLVDSVTAPVVEQVEKTMEQQTEKVAEIVEEVTASPEAVQSADTSTKEEPADEKQDEGTQTTTAEPQNHTVKAAVTKFLPMVLFINPGDTVTWTNMAGHDTTSLDGMIPEGTEKWQSKMGEVFSVTFEQEGAYVYKCTPHVSLGMLGAIIVGDGTPANLEQITGHPDNKGMVKRAIRKMTQALDKR